MTQNEQIWWEAYKISLDRVLYSEADYDREDQLDNEEVKSTAADLADKALVAFQDRFYN